MNNKEINRNSSKLSFVIKVLFVVLLLLVLLSFGVLVVRIANILPLNTDILFIEPKTPETEIADNECVWSEDTQINIFRIKEVNENGEIVVESSTGDKIIAPGMEGEYGFEIRNIGNMAVDTKTVLSVEFKADGLEYDTLPIEVRLINFKGEDLFGNGWINIKDYEECIDELTIGRNSYANYKFYWRWAFESGDDVFDTLLGDLSTKQEVSLTVHIASSAALSEDPSSSGGLSLGDDVIRTGGDIVLVPYIILNCLIVTILVVLLILNKKKRENDSIKIKESLQDEAEI